MCVCVCVCVRVCCLCLCVGVCVCVCACVCVCVTEERALVRASAQHATGTVCARARHRLQLRASGWASMLTPSPNRNFRHCQKIRSAKSQPKKYYLTPSKIAFSGIAIITVTTVRLRVTNLHRGDQERRERRGKLSVTSVWRICRTDLCLICTTLQPLALFTRGLCKFPKSSCTCAKA